jgi:hypothetical protein
MKTTVETKFDVGDIVYVVDHYYDFYPISKPYVVQDVIIRITSDSIHIQYEIDQEGISSYVPEGWVFETYTECTKWCEEHN